MRLWGNGAGGCRGRRSVRIGRVTGATAGPLARRCTALPLTLAAPLAPGARASVRFALDLRVPRRADRFGRGGPGLALLSNAVPALAHLEGGAWRLDRWFAIGEAWTYPAADWTVRLDTPPGVSVAAPGIRQPDGSRRLARGRDFSFAAGRLRALRARVAGVAVHVWAPYGQPRRRLAAALAIVRDRLPRLAALYGPYGWPDLHVVLTGAAAMEHTGLIMTPPYDVVVTHELAHQWWYALVSSDQAQAPWLDEAFASYAEEAAGARPRPWCRRPGAGAGLTTRGTAFFRGRERLGYGFVYAEGACLLDLLERRMGAERFRDALRAYALANRHGWSTGPEFRAAVEAASPVGLDDLWLRFGVA